VVTATSLVLRLLRISFGASSVGDVKFASRAHQGSSSISRLVKCKSAIAVHQERVLLWGRRTAPALDYLQMGRRRNGRGSRRLFAIASRCLADYPVPPQNRM